jgi:hypothetical protein
MTDKPAQVAGVKWRACLRFGIRLVSLASGLLLASCGNCSSPSPSVRSVRVPERPAYDPRDPIYWRVEGVDPMVLEYIPPFDTEKFLLAGTIDFHNRYPSAVMLTIREPRHGATCSAVLLAPQIALTAGHCVCKRKTSSSSEAPGKTFIDASACMERVRVITVFFGKIHSDLDAEAETATYEGVVHPHPEFQLVLDEKGEVLADHANLALITLQRPVKRKLPYVSLGQTEVQAGEMLVMSGFGSDERIGQWDQLRYFRTNKVTRSLDAGRFLYEQQGGYLYNGFDGGPSFREHVEGRRLVGIASLGTESQLSLTSTVFYRDWIQSEMTRLLDEARLPTSKDSHR